MAKQCPSCNGELRRGDAMVKCGNCGGVFCPRCMKKGLMSSSCPFCGTNAQKGTVIARG